MITLFTEPLYVTYIAALAVSICISFALLGYLWQRRHKAVIPVIGLLTAIIFWSAGYMLEQLSPDVNSKLFMYNIEYLE
jgi:hypothetical protein